MKVKNILTALLLMVAGVQKADAQGFRVYNSDGTVMQFSFRTDSIVFYDGIGSDVDFGPYTPVNQMIVGTWYLSKTETVTFREDGTTDHMGGTTYKFFPLQGNIVFYNAANVPVNIFKVVDLTEGRMVVNGKHNDSNFFVLTRTQPSQLVTKIILSEISIILQPDKSKRLTATVYPFDADNMEVTWESSDETVAQVIDNGLVVAVGNGTCVITCRATDGSGVYAECQVMVGEPIDVTCAEAVQLATALENGITSTEIYAVTGYITAVVGSVYSGDNYHQQTFWMADTKDGGRVFEAYYANLPEGIEFGFEVGMKVKITGQLTKYMNSSGVVFPEIKNATVVILENSDGGGGGIEVDEGIAVTCAEAVQLTSALADGATSTGTYTITGYITELVGNVSKNQQTFWMADTKDGGKIFEAYWANLPEGVTEFKAGMKVKITGHLMKYVKDDVMTPEIKNATVVILEDGDDGGQGGDIQHITIAEFLAEADSSTTYELTGIVKDITNTTFGNFDLIEGDASICIYGLLDKEGNARNFASLGIEEGDEVTLTGKYMLYNDKPEIANAQFVSVKKGDGGGGDEPGPGGDVVTDLVNGGFESWVSDTEPAGWKSASTAGTAELAKSTDAHGGSFACIVKAPGSSNKRLATQEITLEAGSYTFSFYAKSTTADLSQARAGYVPVVDGIVGAYKYNSYTDLSNTEWTKISFDFELTEQTTLCLIVMNPKDSSYSISQDILIDDATLTKK